VIEALYVVEVPMSLPLDARVPDEEIAAAKRAVTRAKEVGEEYEGVVVATAMVRARAAGEAIVSEAKRRGVEAIVLAAEKPTRMRGGKLLGGRGGPRDRSVGETTRYVLEKAPCRVVLTAPPVDYLCDHEMTSLLVRDACFAAPIPNYATRQWEPAPPLGKIPHLYYMDALLEAGIERADAFVASTDGDNTNLVIAQIAQKRFDVKTVVVRVLDPARATWYEQQGLRTVCPTKIAIEMLDEAVNEGLGVS